MPELFISYKSEDRPWAERLYNDLRRRQGFDIFLDRESIPAGADWRAVLNDRMRATRHLAVLISDRAAASQEVRHEIAAFEQSSAGNPDRMLFFIYLQGEYTPVGAIQGFPDMKTLQVYDPAAADLGLSKLASDPAQTAWNRIVQAISDRMMAVEKRQHVTLAVFALDNGPTQAGALSQNLDYRMMMAEPTLREFLDGMGLDLVSVQQRYGPSAFDWKPFGTAKTIIDVMDELRAAANANLKPELWFTWDRRDIIAEAKSFTSETQWNGLIDELLDRPSVLVVDPISLYHMAAGLFHRLAPYAKAPQSTILSFSPVESPGTDLIYRVLRSKTAPVLTHYFQPPIPPTDKHGQCGLDVRHVAEIERLIRWNLGNYYVQQNARRGKSRLRMV